MSERKTTQKDQIRGVLMNPLKGKGNRSTLRTSRPQQKGTFRIAGRSQKTRGDRKIIILACQKRKEIKEKGGFFQSDLGIKNKFPKRVFHVILQGKLEGARERLGGKPQKKSRGRSESHVHIKWEEQRGPLWKILKLSLRKTAVREIGVRKEMGRAPKKNNFRNRQADGGNTFVCFEKKGVCRKNLRGCTEKGKLHPFLSRDASFQGGDPNRG